MIINSFSLDENTCLMKLDDNININNNNINNSNIDQPHGEIQYWIDQWLYKYGKFDPRYCINNAKYVYIFEFLNIVVSFVPSILILIYIFFNKFSSQTIGKVAIIMSLLQILITTTYFVTGIPSYRMKYWPYGLISAVWIIGPLITLYWGYNQILNNQL